MTHARSVVPDGYGEGAGPSAVAQSSPILLALAAFAGVASTAAVATQKFVRPDYAILFGALIAAGEMARVRLPGGREAAPLGAAVALAYALVTEIGKQPARHDTAQTIAVAGFGFLAGSLPHLAVRRPTTLD